MPLSQKILIIQTAFLGDVILATALIEKIHLHYPQAQIDFLVRKGNESVLQNNPFLHKIMIFDKKKKYQRLIPLIRTIRKQYYDRVINVQRYFTTGLITILSGAKNTIGFKSNPLSYFFTKRVFHSFNDIHEVERNQLLIKDFTDTFFAQPKVYPSNADREKAMPYIVPQYITISAGSVWKTKKYPLMKWVQFIQKINPSYVIYLLGSKAEWQEAELIQQKTQNSNVVNLCGELNLLASAVLMQNAIMNYCNDSAPTHIASAINAPIVSIFCSTSPRFGFGPISDKAHIVETKQKLDCKPCTNHGKKECPLKHFECGEGIQNKQLLELLPSKNE